MKNEKNTNKVLNKSEKQKDISFDIILQNIDKSTSRYVDISFDISDILKNYKKKYFLSQKEIAIKINKKESEISKWFSGTHNFTIKTISKIEELIGRKILFIENDLLFYSNNKIIAKSINEIQLAQSSDTEIKQNGSITTFKVKKNTTPITIGQNNLEYCIN